MHARAVRNQLGQLARERVNQYRGHALACLVAADRYQHLTDEIWPALAHGHVVICDRYVASSYVLQQMDGVPLPFIVAINSAATRPDLSIVLTADAAELAARITARGSAHRFESGIEAARQECELYTTVVLAQREIGWDATIVDTTGRSAGEVTGELTNLVHAVAAAIS